jgi:hypothetical protein
MKKLITSTLLIVCCTCATAQSTLNFTPLRTEMLDSIHKVNHSKQLLSQGGIDNLFAVKTAKYFGSAGDVTVYKNYFFGNVSDGTLSFGKNLDISGKKATRTSDLMSIGFQSQAEDNFSSIYSNDGFAGQIGIDFKYSHICKGKMFYSTGIQLQGLNKSISREVKPDTTTMRIERMKIYGVLSAKMKNDSIEFISSIAYLSDAERKIQIESFMKEQTDAYWKSFAELEATAVEDSSAYGAAKTSWWSIGFHLPVTGKTYLVAPNLNDPFVEREDWLAYVEGIYTRVRDSRRFGLTLLTLSARFGNFNNVEAKELTETTITKYQSLGGNDTLALTEVGKQALYVGELERFNVTTLQARVVHFMPGDFGWIGVSATYKYEIAQKNTMNLAFGIPLSLSGQKENSKVNVELQFKIIDLTDEIPESGEKEFNYQFGINVGIPFGGVDL